MIAVCHERCAKEGDMDGRRMPSGLSNEEEWLIRSFSSVAPEENLSGLGAQGAFCKIMRSVRNDAGLSQGEVAGILGTSQSTISNLEMGGGELYLSLLRLHRLMTAYGISVKLIFEWNG
jgi:DNA-binding XRE family transcriptional regulator